MDLRPHEVDLFASSLDPFLSLTGDRRTAALLTETLRGILGILGSESLVCSRIAAFSPWARRQSLC
jgi:hypothetical protein